MAAVTVSVKVGESTFEYGWDASYLEGSAYDHEARLVLERLETAVRRVRAGIISGMSSENSTPTVVESGPVNVNLIERR
jgi:hypothetical protein